MNRISNIEKEIIELKAIYADMLYRHLPWDLNGHGKEYYRAKIALLEQALNRGK